MGAVAPGITRDLLAQRMEHGERCIAPILGIHLDIVADGVRGPETDDGVCREPLLLDDPIKQRLRVIEQLARLGTELLVVEDHRIAPLELPGLEEGRPIDARDEIGEIVGFEARHAHGCGALRLVARPVDLELVLARGFNRDPLLGLIRTQVCLSRLVVLGADVGDIRIAIGVREQLRDDTDRAARVEHVDRLVARVIRADLDGCMHAARRCAADQQRHVEALALHLRGDGAHLVERGRDETGETDNVCLLLARDLEDFRRRDHDTQIDDLVVVALENDTDDVLADIVDIALHGRHDDLAGSGLVGEARGLLLGLQKGLQVSNGLLHHARGLDDLRQEHLAGAEEIADDVHAGHQRTLDDMQRLRGSLPRLLRVGLDEIRDAMHERVLETLRDIALAPREIHFLALGAIALEALRGFEQTVRSIRAAIEDHILAKLAQLRLDIVIDRELSRIDDGHVHAGLDGVVQEHRVHGLAHSLVATEGEREVGDAPRDVRVRARRLDLPDGFDEGDAVAVVLLDPGGHREDVRVEDNVLRREAKLFGEQLVGARADLDLALDSIGLPLLVEGHHDDGGTIATHPARLLEKGRLAFLHADRIDDRFTLDALETGLDHAPLGAVDHHGHARDIGLGGDHVEERSHGLLAVEKALVHVHVENLGAALDLFTGHREGSGIVTGLDELPELGRTGDVRAFADIDEGRRRGGRLSCRGHGEKRGPA